MTPLEVAKETFKPHFCQFGHKRALYAMILVFGDQLNGVRADLNGLDTQKCHMGNNVVSEMDTFLTVFILQSKNE